MWEARDGLKCRVDSVCLSLGLTFCGCLLLPTSAAKLDKLPEYLRDTVDWFMGWVAAVGRREVAPSVRQAYLWPLISGLFKYKCTRKSPYFCGHFCLWLLATWWPVRLTCHGRRSPIALATASIFDLPLNITVPYYPPAALCCPLGGSACVRECVLPWSTCCPAPLLCITCRALPYLLAR